MPDTPEIRAPQGEFDSGQASPPIVSVRPAREKYVVTTALIAINVLLFLAVEATGGTSTGNLLRWGADFGPRTLSGEWWRMVASIFLHGGLLHILFNMLALWSLGPLMEKLIGRLPFLLMYLACGVGGSMLSLWWHPMIVSIGASGAIFGVAGALLAVLYLKHVPIPKEYLKKNLGSVGAFVVYNLLFGAVAHGVDNAAHIGGLVSGLAIGAALVPVFDHQASVLRRYIVFPLFALVLLGGMSMAQRGSEGLREFAAGSDLVDQQDYAAAVPHLKRAVQLEPRNSEAQFQLGYAYLKMGQIADALAPMSEAVRLAPGDYAAQLNLGLIYLNLNRAAEAVPHLKIAAEKHPDGESWYFLGVASFTAGQHDQALHALQQSLALDPDGPNAASAKEIIGLLQKGQAAPTAPR